MSDRSVAVLVRYATGKNYAPLADVERILAEFRRRDTNLEAAFRIAQARGQEKIRVVADDWDVAEEYPASDSQGRLYHSATEWADLFVLEGGAWDGAKEVAVTVAFIYRVGQEVVETKRMQLSVDVQRLWRRVIRDTPAWRRAEIEAEYRALFGAPLT